ncbi:DUF4920 domain-containing protein [Shewanella sp. SR44-3]|uniref:DUF4920 domain-containing protein n=1 Tax=Shewanella sp. SR44-3 TaxID=2760936 RepID=UPI0015F8E1E9|nr:DUF4920 domain-containing protein [Shewanella sp. SR44-3]MBB1269698.1 DUF4920 domain-containing protein [Shewanella sp. SR44-3]
MNKYTLLLLAGLLAPLAQAATDKFGEAVDLKKLIPVAELMASPSEHLQQAVTIEGTVVSVCTKRGCWMEIAAQESSERLRVKVRDGDMVFPISARGKHAYATGMLTEIVLSPEQSRSYLENQAKKNQQVFDASAAIEAVTLYQLQPIGVEIRETH